MNHRLVRGLSQKLRLMVPGETNRGWPLASADIQIHVVCMHAQTHAKIHVMCMHACVHIHVTHTGKGWHASSHIHITHSGGGATKPLGLKRCQVTEYRTQWPCWAAHNCLQLQFRGTEGSALFRNLHFHACTHTYTLCWLVSVST